MAVGGLCNATEEKYGGTSTPDLNDRAYFNAHTWPHHSLFAEGSNDKHAEQIRRESAGRPEKNPASIKATVRVDQPGTGSMEYTQTDGVQALPRRAHEGTGADGICARVECGPHTGVLLQSLTPLVIGDNSRHTFSPSLGDSFSVKKKRDREKTLSDTK